MICVVSRGWICMALIDSDVVQMPNGECEIEMNVTDRTGLVLYINGLWKCCSHREGRLV